MTIIEAINRVDALKHNTYSQATKIGWLSNLDAKVKTLVIDTHEGAEKIPFTGYNESTDLQTQLLVPTPFDEVYPRWLEAQIDYHNGENDKYNAAIILYNTVFEAYESYYNRNNMPAKRPNRFVF